MSLLYYIPHTPSPYSLMILCLKFLIDYFFSWCSICDDLGGFCGIIIIYIIHTHEKKYENRN